MIALSYDFVKNEIQKKGCELLSDKYINQTKKLKILFSCGHIGERDYAGFKVSDPICKKCSHHETLTTKEAIVELLKYGYDLINENYAGTQHKIVIKDKEGYFYTVVYKQFLRNIKENRLFSKFEKSNINAMKNIELWLKINCSNLKIKENQEYNGELKKMTFIDNLGYLYWLNLNAILQNTKNGNWFSIVDPHNIYSLYNIELWIKNNNKSFKLIKEQKYNNQNERLYFKCLICKDDEYDFKKSWNEILTGDGCPYCNNRQIGKYNNLAYKNPEMSRQWHLTRNGSTTPSMVFLNTNKKYWWTCENGHDYPASPNSRNGIQKSGCPFCQKSKGENRISLFLNKNYFYFTEQYRILNCKNILQLPFDFAIFGEEHKNELVCLLEYDGELHFKPRKDDDNSSTRLKLCQKRDDIKTKYCQDNNIKLIRIPYWDFNNIEKILEKELDIHRKEEKDIG